MKTRAIVFSEQNRVEVQEVIVPEPGPEEVLVRSVQSGVSVGTDGWILTNQFTWGGDIPYPVVPGYQRAGFVEAMGAKVEGLKVGQRVAVAGSRLEGKPGSYWGGHLHLGVTSQTDIFLLPEGVSFANGAQVIVAQVGYNAAARSMAGVGETVLVLGDGGIGQMAAQAARVRGARIILGGHRAERIELARRHSCDEVLLTRDPGWVKRLESRESPITAVIDTVQDEAFFQTYLPHLPARTNVVLSGFSPAGFHIDMGELQKKEVALLSVAGWSRQRCEETLQLMRLGKLNLEGLLTHVVPAAEAPRIYNMIRLKLEPFLGVNFLWE